VRRHRHVRDRAESRTQRVALLAKPCKALGDLGIPGKVRLHLRATGSRKQPIDIGVEIVL
jgi:hypothetical protein